MKNSLHYITILTVLLFSCSNQTIVDNIVYDLDKQKISIYGSISPQDGVLIASNKSGPVLGQVLYESLALENPIVELFEADELITRAEQINNQFIIENIPVLSEKDYHIVASEKNLPSVRSNAVSIPPSPEWSNLKMQATGDSTINNLPIYKISLNIEFTNNLDYYELSIGVPNHNIEFETWTNDDITTICNLKKSSLSSYFFTSDCLNSSQNFELFTEIPTAIGNIDIDTIQLKLSAIDQNLFSYYETSIQPRDEENFFAEPQLSYSNIIDGFGIFYAYNSIDSIFVL